VTVCLGRVTAIFCAERGHLRKLLAANLLPARAASIVAVRATATIWGQLLAEVNGDVLGSTKATSRFLLAAGSNRHILHSKRATASFLLAAKGIFLLAARAAVNLFVVEGD
jgi:hypothetical protein